MKKQSRKMNAINPPAGAVGDVQARIDRFFLMIAVFWTIVILAAAGLHYREAYSSAMAIAREGLLHSYSKELAFRSWRPSTAEFTFLLRPKRHPILTWRTFRKEISKPLQGNNLP